MKNILTILFLLIICSNFAQNKEEFDLLLNQISKETNSKVLKDLDQTKKICEYDKNAIPILELFFTDSTKTNMYSEYKKRNLCKGEIAILLVDYIDKISYFIYIIPACGYPSERFKNLDMERFLPGEKGLQGFKNRYNFFYKRYHHRK